MVADTTKPAEQPNDQQEGWDGMADWTTVSPTASEEEIAAMVIGRVS